MIQLTRFTSERPNRLSKAFHLTDGKLVKEQGGAMTEGWAEKLQLKHFGDLADTLTALNGNQAFGYGVCEHDKARVVTREALKHIKPNGSPPVVARTNDAFQYSADEAILMLDYDCGENTPLTDVELLEKIYVLWPELRDAPHMLTASASSHIYNKETEECLKGRGGLRLLVAVKHGSDIKRAMDTLFERSWLNGDGEIQVSKSGSLLVVDFFGNVPKNSHDILPFRNQQSDTCSKMSLHFCKRFPR